jgi:hypothetical protein
MRTFAEKSRTPQQAALAKSRVRRPAPFAQSHDVSSILRLQRAIRNHAAQRLLRARPELAEVNPAGEKGAIPPSVQEVLNSPGQPLDAKTRGFMESRFEHDFSGVRVHADTRASQSAAEVSAQAYTVGDHVVLSDYQPATAAGRAVLSHELARSDPSASNPDWKTLPIMRRLA